MKNIKFRVWDSTDKKMYYKFDSINFNDGVYEGVLIKETYNRCGGIDEYIFRSSSECELMRYTGLDDENSKEIYDDDIIECDYDDYHDPYGVRYSHGGRYRFVASYGDEMLEQLVINEQCQVVGNIYENPELLKEK